MYVEFLADKGILTVFRRQFVGKYAISLVYVVVSLSVEEYAQSLYYFLTGFGTGVDVKFSERRLIGIGIPIAD